MRCLSLALVGTVLLACATRPLHERDWVEVRTPHFEIVSSLDRDATLALAEDAELFYAATEFVMGARHPAAAVPRTIYAFDGRGITRPFDVRGAPGYFLPSMRETLIVLRTGGGWESDATVELRHELAHQLVRSHGGAGQHLWFDEGAAEFLSTIEVRGDQVELGQFRLDHMRRLRDQPWVPLLRVLEANDLEGWGDERRLVFRAESWGFVHYLNFGPGGGQRGSAQLGRYFQRIAAGDSHEQAVRQGFGTSVGKLDRKLRGYLKRDRLDSAAVRFGSGQAADTAEPKPLARDEVLERLGWLSISLGRAKQAQRYFEKAVAANPQRSRAHAGLGAADRLRGRWDTALAHLERALALAPDDALNHLDLGLCYHDQAREAGTAEARAELAERARSHYARSTELAERLPEPYARYGATFLLEGQSPEQGLAPLEHAGRLLPASLEIRLLTARIYLGLARYELARAAAVEVLSRTHTAAAKAEADGILAEIHRRVPPREILLSAP